MKIVIDARWIHREISGVGAYTRALIRELGRLDNPHRYVLLFQEPELRDRTLAESALIGHPAFETALLPYGLFSMRNQFALGPWLAHAGADIFHSPNYMIPLPAFPRRGPHRCRAVVTIHDVIPLIFPNHAPRSKKARLFFIYRRLMHEIGRRADRIVSDSDASARDVARHLAINTARQAPVQTIHCGVDAVFRPLARPAAAAAQEATRERCLLYVGRTDPYKNVPLLVRAFATARTRCPFPLRLIIAGSVDPRYPEAQTAARQMGVADAVQWTGYISDAALLAHYQTADALVHPSRYEGFGLQIVEAMACGLPVICGNGGSLPEVAGDAAIVLDSDDEAAFANAIVHLLTTPALAADLRQRGMSRAATFTWARTARETLALYESLAQRPQPEGRTS